MIGAIVSGTLCPVYEWHNIKTMDFPLFRDDCFFADDTATVSSIFLIFDVVSANKRRQKCIDKSCFIG